MLTENLFIPTNATLSHSLKLSDGAHKPRALPRPVHLVVLTLAVFLVCENSRRNNVDGRMLHLRMGEVFESVSVLDGCRRYLFFDRSGKVYTATRRGRFCEFFGEECALFVTIAATV
jgi:hypothetical protein